MHFIGDLDWHTLRLGAFHVLVAVGERSVDIRESLLQRFEDILFHRIYRDDPAFESFSAYVDPDAFRRIEHRAQEMHPNPAAALLPPETEMPWFHTVELWQSDRRLESGVGPIAQDHAHRFIDLGVKLGILTPSFAVSECGELLRAFYSQDHPLIDPQSPNPNPLLVESLASRIILLYALLHEDGLFPLLLSEFVAAPDAGIARAYRRVEGESVPGLLLRAADRLYDRLASKVDVYTALESQQLRLYRERISEKKNHLNQALPRMEFAVDLGLIGRAPRKAGEPMYSVTEATRRFVLSFPNMMNNPEEGQVQLDTEFFRRSAYTFGLEASPIDSDDERLLWFCRGFKMIRRSGGFTPGRTVSFAAALLALAAKRTVEVPEMFRTVYAAAHGPWSSYLGFSGGSRFDDEFLIRIDDALESQIEERLGSA